MCGLFGAIDSKPITPELSSKMLQAIAFRGPDGNGFCDLSEKDGPILGHTRLAIIGGESAAQPMWSKDGRFCLTFNGEIYNFEDLAKEFGINHEGSDTRLLVELWGRIKAKSIPMLRGQFAFSIWDDLEKVVTLVTDYFGVLPLYIHEQEDSVYWASSARVFRAANLPLTVAKSSVSDLLHFRFVPSPRSVFKEVSKLRPGSVVEISANREISFGSWSNSIVSSELLELADTSRLTKAIRVAVRQSLKADQEVGIFLSGGVDSAVIAHLAAEHSEKPVKAFTASWHANDQNSELTAAQKTAEALNIEIIPVEIDAKEWWRAFNQSIEFRESPTTEIADPVMFLLSERASKQVKVVLSGEGVDELFYGYPKFAVENMLSNRFSRALVRLAISVFATVNSKSARLSRLKTAISFNSKLARWNAYFANSTFSQSAGAKNRVRGSEGDIRGLRDHDLRGYLPHVLLERADRMGMANGLEIRPSMLSLDLLELAEMLPTQNQTKFMKTKIAFRCSASEFVGKEIAWRKSRGFPIPLAYWIKNELAADFESTLKSSQTLLNEYVSPTTRLNYLDAHLKGRKDHSLLLFTWASFILWEEFWT
jgi:asparagine synthase (glutamine-hydrolysing)